MQVRKICLWDYLSAICLAENKLNSLRHEKIRNGNFPYFFVQKVMCETGFSVIFETCFIKKVIV